MQLNDFDGLPVSKIHSTKHGNREAYTTNYNIDLLNTRNTPDIEKFQPGSNRQRYINNMKYKAVGMAKKTAKKSTI